MIRSALGVLVCLAIGYTTLDYVGQMKAAKPKVFVCEDDGVIVERHVDVATAYTEHRTTLWYIAYTDGRVAWYNQPHGETCYEERAADER